MKKMYNSGKTILATTAGLLFFSALFIACTKYRDVPSKYGTFTPPPTGTIGPGSLRINEYICKGSDAAATDSLGGLTYKWFELYNPTSQSIMLTAGQWFLTDTLGIKNKFPVPQNTAGVQWSVPAHGYLVVVANKSSQTPVPGRINTGFSLSSSAGDIGIYYQATPASPLIPIDSLHYNNGSSPLNNLTYGRYPDGQDPATGARGQVTFGAANKP